MQKKHIIIICGEASGDLNAASLAMAIKKILPDIKISAVGGTLMRGIADEMYCDIKDLAVMGFFGVLKKLPKFFALKDLILQKIKTQNPDCIILVDFSGFNLRLARAINKSIPVIYYTSPQVWASRAGRLNTIKKYVHRMLVLFKFEKDFYKRGGVNADFVGHPLLDIVKPTMDKKELLNSLKFSESNTTIALLPGSRRQEIENILPIMLKASFLIDKKIPNAQFVIAKSPQVSWDIYNNKIKGFKLNLKIVESKTYDCLNIADFCIVTSGTATLETAIMQKSFCVVYKMNILNYLLYRPQVKVPFIGIINIVAGRKIVPEFIQFYATPKNISTQVLRLLKDDDALEKMKKDLAQANSLLGEKGASLRAAQIIVKSLQDKNFGL